MLAYEQGMTPAKAFRLGFSKSAEEQLNIAAVVLGIDEHKVSLSEVQKMIGSDMLLLQLDGPNDSRGVVAIDREVMTGLIEAQTIGYVTNKKASDRTPTKTDGAMCETFLNYAFDEFTALMFDVKSIEWGSDFQTGAFIQSIRLLELILEDVPYVLNKVNIDLSEGAKQGAMFLVFPAKNNASLIKSQNTPVDDQADWSETLMKAVGVSRVHLNAVLHRTHLSLERVRALQIDDLIDVPMSAVSELHLEGATGRCITLAKLGQQDGCRAARILTTVGIATETASTSPLENVAQAALAPMEAAPMAEQLVMETDMPDLEIQPIGDLPQIDITETPMPMADLPMAPMMGDLPDLSIDTALPDLKALDDLGSE